MTLPNFIGIGVQRAATTWLHDCLNEHPDIFLPVEKELNFFNQQFDLGIDWYRSKFSGADGQSAIGEITPLYLHTAPLDRIRATCPDAKLIVILREPVDRAYSCYKLMQEKFFADVTFSQAMATGRGSAILSHSLYAEKLQQTIGLFGRERLLVEIYDDVLQNPLQLLSRVCGHLGVDPEFVPSRLGVVTNRIIFPRLQRQLQRVGLGAAVEAVKGSPLGPAIRRWSKRRQTKVDTSSEMLTFRESHADRFREDILQCQEIIGRDLSQWLTRI